MQNHDHNRSKFVPKMRYILTDTDFDKYELWHKENYKTEEKMAKPLQEGFEQLRRDWNGKNLFEISITSAKETTEEKRFSLPEWVNYQLRLRLEDILFPMIPYASDCTCQEKYDEIGVIDDGKMILCDNCRNASYVQLGYTHP